MFHKCRLGFEKTADGVKSHLESKGFGFVSPDVLGMKGGLPGPIETDLDDLEMSYVLRKVRL